MTIDEVETILFDQIRILAEFNSHKTTQEVLPEQVRSNAETIMNIYKTIFKEADYP